MRKKKYSTFEQIDSDLKILEIESEISRQKIILEFDYMKENFKPKNLVNSLVGNYIPHSSGKYSKIIALAMPFITKWLFKKKRGH